jgi:hypothetical protein
MKQSVRVRIYMFLLASPLIALTMSTLEYKELILSPIAYCIVFVAFWYMGSRNLGRIAHFYYTNGFNLQQDALYGSRSINEVMALGIAARNGGSIGFVHVCIQCFFYSVCGILDYFSAGLCGPSISITIELRWSFIRVPFTSFDRDQRF